MSDLPKLPGGWAWGPKTTERYANAHSPDNSEMVDAAKSDTKAAVARVVAMVTAIVEKEATDAK